MAALQPAPSSARRTFFEESWRFCPLEEVAAAARVQPSGTPTARFPEASIFSGAKPFQPHQRFADPASSSDGPSISPWQLSTPRQPIIRESAHNGSSRTVSAFHPVAYPRLVEVPVERVVDKPYHVERVVEVPYPVERVVEHRREVPVERVVDKPYHVDRVVDVHVDTPVKVSYTVPRVVERVTHTHVPVPIITTRDVLLPSLTVVEQPREVVSELRVPVDRQVDRAVEFARYRDRELFEDIEIEVPRESVREVPVTTEEVVEVDYPHERAVPRFVESVVEKPIELQRRVKRPVCRTRVVERQHPKVVERRVEVPVERIVEVPVYIEVRKPVTLERRVQRPRPVEKRSQQHLRRSVVRDRVSATQKEAFVQVSEQLMAVRVDNFKLGLEMETLTQQLAGDARLSVNPASAARDNETMQRRVGDLERDVRSLEAENARLAADLATPIVEREAVEGFSPAELRELEAQVHSAEEKNRQLRNALNFSATSTADAHSAVQLPRYSHQYTALSEVVDRSAWSRLVETKQLRVPPAPLFKSSLPSRVAEALAPLSRRSSPALRAALEESLLISARKTRADLDSTIDLPFTRAYQLAVQR